MVYLLAIHARPKTREPAPACSTGQIQFERGRNIGDRLPIHLIAKRVEPKTNEAAPRKTARPFPPSNIFQQEAHAGQGDSGSRHDAADQQHKPEKRETGFAYGAAFNSRPVQHVEATTAPGAACAPVGDPPAVDSAASI